MFHKGADNEDEVSFFVLVDDANFHEYIKFRNERIIFYAYINPLGYVPAWSHGHSDLGGYILYLDGQCILIGTGRKNYLHYPGADYWRSAKSHNSITIDNKGLCSVHGLDSLPEETIIPLLAISGIGFVSGIVLINYKAKHSKRDKSKFKRTNTKSWDT